MVRVLLHRRADGSLQGYEIRGHAAWAQAGQDIVCAALSFLSITCANALEAIAGLKPRVTEGEGYLKVLAPEGGGQADTILRVFELGVRELAAGYPKNVRLRDMGQSDENGGRPDDQA